MIKKTLFLSALMLLSTSVLAEDQAEQQARYKLLMDRAAEMAKRNENSATVNQTQMTPEQIRETMDKAEAKSQKGSGNIGELIDRAYVRHTEGAVQKNTAASTAAKAALQKNPDTIDPAEIAKLYRTPVMKGELAGPKDELLVFISTSIPSETLKVIGTQAKRAGAILVLRGVTGGFSGRNLKAMMRQLKPATEQGADVQINPELFKRYGITTVPTTVLASSAGKGCEEGFCTEHAALVGDVSIEYALEEFARRRDGLGRIAEKRLNKMGDRR